MKRLRYDRIGEQLYYERMPNGLDVYVWPKPGFQKTYATFATKYGSIDNHFSIDGVNKQRVPDGIAHFLEHKMFEEPTGDVFAQFSSQGASANAYTTFDRTVYLFSATDQIEDNVETLLNFVQRPYFTEESVEKEKGIIAQEINMYKDNPDWQSYFGLIRALYRKHPVHIDIAGTIDSIGKITKDLLYDCYNTFYHPENMMLFVVGAVDPEQMMFLIRDNQAKKSFPEQGKIHRYFDPEPNEVRETNRVAKLTVSMPKCLVGFKEIDVELGSREQQVRECETKLMLEILFGSSSDIYRKLYDDQLINDSFSFEYNTGSGYAFSVIGGDTPDPDALVRRLRAEMENVCETGVDERSFERARKKKIGGFLRMLNSTEAIANEFTRCHFRGQDLFDVLDIYEKMRPDQVNDRLRQHVQQSPMAVSVVNNDA